VAAAIALLAALPAEPPRPPVAQLLRVLRDYDLRDDIHGLGPEVADAYDAVLAALPAEQCICPDDGDGMALYRSDCPNELHAKRARALPAEPEKENSRE
jgi:hypothetical protein